MGRAPRTRRRTHEARCSARISVSCYTQSLVCTLSIQLAVHFVPLRQLIPSSDSCLRRVHSRSDSVRLFQECRSLCNDVECGPTLAKTSVLHLTDSDITLPLAGRNLARQRYIQSDLCSKFADQSNDLRQYPGHVQSQLLSLQQPRQRTPTKPTRRCY